MEDVEYAAVLHDIGRETEMLGGTNDHEIIGVHLAKPYISHLSQKRQDMITQAIRNHRNAKGRELSLLDHVIRDADRIPFSPEESVRRIYDYRMSRGSTPEEALRRGYHYLRHNKMCRLDKRIDGIHTPEGKALMGDKIKELEAKTRTFKDFVSLIPGVDNKMEFKKTASSTENFYELLKADLKGEFEAIGQYQTHIDNAPKGAIKDKLIEIRDEEKHHVEELQELLEKEDKTKEAGEGLPAGSVTPELKGEAAPRVTNALVPSAQPGVAADMLHAKATDFVRVRATTEEITSKVAAFEINMKNFRNDYTLPSADPADPSKLDNYREVNEGLLDKHHWAPAIKRHLEKEIKFAKGQTGILEKQQEAMQRQQELMVQQQELGLKGQEIGLKAQEAGIKQQSKLTDATVKHMGAQAHRDKKEGDALVISAGKGVQLPASQHATGPMGGVPAGQPIQGQPTQSAPAGDPNQQQGTQQNKVENDQNQEQVKTKQASSVRTVATNFGNRAVKSVGNFAKNVAGRHSELQTLHQELGEHLGRAEAFQTGSLRQQVNAEAAKGLERKILKTKLDVRKSQTDAALGLAGGTAIYHEYSEPKYASADDDGYTLQLNTQRGYAADVMHAIKTLPDGTQTNTKSKLIASAALAGAAAGMTLYGMNKLNPAVASHTIHDKAGLELGKAIGKMVPFIGTVGGGYYASRNGDNKTKRNVGMAVALTSGALLGRQVCDQTVSAHITKQMVIDALPFSVGSVTAAGAIAYGAHPAQQIADQEIIDTAMRSKAPQEEVTHIVNNIREQKNLESRYPIMRYAPVPAGLKKLVNARYGKPAGAMNGHDMAHYFQSQVDVEYRRLLKSYEANNGRPTQACMSELKAAAHDNVTRWLES
jgi:hypothetical protein